MYLYICVFVIIYPTFVGSERNKDLVLLLGPWSRVEGTQSGGGGTASTRPLIIQARGPFVQTLCIEKDSYMDPI